MNADFFFSDNITTKIQKCRSIDTEFATDYYNTNLPNIKIILSTLVGQVKIPSSIHEGNIYPAGTLICTITMLGVIYYIFTEEDSTLIKQVVYDNQIVDYHYPLFLIASSTNRSLEV